MKDNWIKPFQEKLGDYELELPAATPRRVRWIVPLLAGAAAAAAAALLFLLPGTGTKQAALDHRIAEARSYVTPSLTVLPNDIRMPRPMEKPVASVRETQVEQPAPAEPDEPAAPQQPEPQQEDPQPQPQQQPQQSETGQETLNDPDVYWESEPEPVRYASRFSTKLFAGNITTGNQQQQAIETDYQKLYSNYVGIGSDAAKNNLYDFDNVQHAYSANADMPEPETISYLPIKAGLSLRYDFAPRLSVESGLTYSYHHSKQAISGDLAGDYFRNYQLHYLGIPLKLGYSFVQRPRFDAYLSMGGEAEILAFGRVTAVDGATLNPQAVKEHPLQFSLVGAAGAEYRFTPWMGLYVEPGLAWHFKPGGELPNYYREHPWSFDLRIGLRFSLASDSSR